MNQPQEQVQIENEYEDTKRQIDHGFKQVEDQKK